MTEERNRPDSAVETDPLVTRTYRETAHEHAPGHLDQAILKEAAKAVRPRYSRFITWTRPMAWAATIMLSVALVLELTNVPTTTPVIFESGADKFERRELGSDSMQDAPAESLEESVLPAVLPARATNTAVVAAPDAEAIRPAAKQAGPAGLEKAQRDNLRQDRAAVPASTAPATNVDEFKQKDADMLRRAEDMALLQDGQDREAAFAGSSAVAVSADATVQGTAAMAVTTPHCDEAVTARPETWLKCIAELEKTGLADEALLQRDLLRERFPDFDLR
jgi:hypothetical protein